MIGEIISGCRIEEEVGRGATGIVYRAHQIDFDRNVAIKVIRNHFNEEQRKRFQIERRAMARLDHPNIVQPYGFVSHGKYDCLIMKYVDGYSIQELITGRCDYQGRVIASQLNSDWDLFAVLAADAADAIAHAHQNNIIHRDIKPSNLLVDLDKRVWVTDFGLTKLLDDDTSLSSTGNALGTPRYMSPEQTRGMVDERSDVFSLGLTLYALASGSSENIAIASLEDSSVERSCKHLHLVNPDMPKDLAEVVMKACNISPMARFQSANEMRVVIDRFFAGKKPDRRVRLRKPNQLYLRNIKKKAVITSVSCLVAAVVLAFQNQGESVRIGEEVRLNISPAKNPTSILDSFVDSGDHDVDSVVANVIKDNIEHAADRAYLSMDDANALHTRVDSLFEEKGFTDEVINELVGKYRESALSDATRLIRLSRVIERSTISTQEKKSGIESLRRLSFLIIKERIPKKEAIRIEKLLTFDRMLDASEIDSTYFSDHRIRKWLDRILRRINQESAFNSGSIREEIDDLFDQI